MHFWYKLLTYLLFPISPFFLFFRKIRKKENYLRYKEKLSQIRVQRKNGFLLWFHVASVGEAMSILPLIEDLEKEEKINSILITSITLSSSVIIEKKIGKNKKIIHQFLPLDIPQFVNKFLNHWSPNISIFIDSEIWPNLIFAIKKRKIPLLLLNGRITKKTFNKWRLLKYFSKKIFQQFDLCLISNKETGNYLKELGAKNIKDYGNIKFSRTKFKSHDKFNPSFLNRIKDRKIWSAASTHPSEELICAKAHVEIKKTYNNILTVIIPRHIERTKEIEKELSRLNLKTILYSKIENLNNDTDILLVDAYGELLKFYDVSKCVFLGKSLSKNLISSSGQNPIEAARLGCKVFHGPNISNFKDIYEYLNSLKIVSKVSNFMELSQSVVEELNNDKEKNDKIVEKIENYGLNTLKNVLKEIKLYINN